MARIFFLLSFLVFSGSLFAQQPRFALVIGNGNYEFASLGQTPVNDARAMRDALILAGFKVDYYTNLDQSKLTKVSTDFGRKIKDSGGVALFYYSGHGVQHNNTNYLVPIGAEMTDEEEIEGFCIPIGRITSRMLSAGTTTNIILLDVCRAFPMSRGTKNLTQGLVKENYAVPELLVAYATAPGSTATVRGENGLSLYTSQLLKHLKTPDLVLENVLKNTRRDVISKSNGQQRPDETGNLTSDFYFFSASKTVVTEMDRTVLVEPITRPTDSESPSGIDSDLDGTPDATDPCPNEYGTLAANGCPDYDEDDVPNSVDKCPNAAGKKSWQGCPDSDDDGLPDHEDKCPTEKGALIDNGCPPPDVDRDGVPDATDLCPEKYGLKTLSGCPDSDADGVANKSDKCPNIAGLPRYQGCPDTDSDGIPDHEDNCPTVKGMATAKGCPEISQFGYRSDDFLRVQGGTFEMGSNDGDSNEKPIHQVTVPDFELGRYEVTNMQFCIFLNDITNSIGISNNGCEVTYKGNVIFDILCGGRKGGCNDFKENIDYSGNNKPGGRFNPVSGFENNPVAMVSWWGAKTYCEWLNQKSGHAYRMPSEAEWEYAARGGNQSSIYKYSGGNQVDGVAWYSSNSDSKSHPVGEKDSNELIFHDMSGNVWEWCADTWFEDYKNAPKDGSAWISSTSETAVLRGGSWNAIERNCRVACRRSNLRTYRRNDFGFRVARTVIDQ